VLDAATNALRRELNVELSGAIKSLLRRLQEQPSLLDVRDLIAWAGLHEASASMASASSQNAHSCPDGA
jgi:hypothetical protein